MIYAKTSRGFRCGGLNGASSNAEGGFVPFEPEVATDYELGLKSDWLGGALRVNAAAYYTDYKQIQRSVVVSTSTGSFTTIIQNAAKASIKGAELEVIARPVAGLTLTGTLGYTDATYDRFIDLGRDRSGEKFAVPKWTYSLSGRYAAPIGPGTFSVQADWFWRDRVVFEPTATQLDSVSQEAYGLLNGRISYDLAEHDLEIAVFGRNLLDKTYRGSALSLEPVGFNIAYTGDRRVWGIQLRRRFGGG
jgi:iron complex outermembrane recepter protein